MKIWYAPYTLQPLSTLNRFRNNVRSGFLIKIQNKDISAGYADVHPIAEFGDGSVDLLLKKMKSKKLTPLLKRAIHLAKVDGKAREEKKSLFIKTPVKSHYTCTNVASIHQKLIADILERGFTTIKVKVGGDVLLEARAINKLPESIKSSLRWRFDANCGEGDTFLKNLDESFFSNIDFIEDPIPFKLKSWLAITNDYGVACAFDKPIGTKKQNEFRGIRVLKPAREAIMPRKVDVITNSMDHPVGQSFAVWAAQTAIQKFQGQTRDYGLQTSHLFSSNPFFEEIKTDTAFFKVSDGYGIGFNELLEGQEWQSL